MRTVAVTFVILSTLALFPPGLAADECQLDVQHGTICVSTGDLLNRQSTPPGVPNPNEPYYGKYYLWIGPGHCLPNPLVLDCRGSLAPGSGTALPYEAGGGSLPIGLFGVLYQESNGVPGLQRTPVVSGGLRPPDHMVLI